MIIPFSKTEIMPKDIKLVNQVLRSGWLTHGKYTNLFENEFNENHILAIGINDVIKQDQIKKYLKNFDQF